MRLEYAYQCSRDASPGLGSAKHTRFREKYQSFLLIVQNLGLRKKHLRVAELKYLIWSSFWNQFQCYVFIVFWSVLTYVLNTRLHEQASGNESKLLMRLWLRRQSFEKYLRHIDFRKSFLVRCRLPTLQGFDFFDWWKEKCGTHIARRTFWQLRQE